MKRTLSVILVSVIILPFIIWGLTVLKCEILTYQHGGEFDTIYKENTMMGAIDYLKILNYSNESARVYYVSKDRSGGDILIFTKKDEKWIYEGWERTVWSKSGSADGFIWPYIR